MAPPLQLMGDVVNLGARLMTCRGGAPGVVVDHPTYKACMEASAAIRFEKMEPLTLKGMSKPVKAYIASKGQRGPLPQAAPETPEKLDMGGRDEEALQLDEMVMQLIKHRGGTLVLTGERGSGKSPLVTRLMETGDRLGLTVLYVPKKTRSLQPGGIFPRAVGGSELPPVFTAWHAIFEQLVTTAVGPEGSDDEQVAFLRAALEKREPGLLTQIELLGNILPALADKFGDVAADARRRGIASPKVISTFERKKKLSDPHVGGLPAPRQGLQRTRSATVSSYQQPLNDTLSDSVETLSRMLYHIAVFYAENSPTLIVLHLQTGTALKAAVDPESWELAAKLCEHSRNRRKLRHKGKPLPPFIVSVVTRPMGHVDEPIIASIWEAAASSGSQMHLGPLDDMARLKYTAQVLSELANTPVSQAAIAPELVQLLDDRAAGNPKHIKEMIKVGCERRRGKRDIGGDVGGRAGAGASGGESCPPPALVHCNRCPRRLTSVPGSRLSPCCRPCTARTTMASPRFAFATTGAWRC